MLSFACAVSNDGLLNMFAFMMCSMCVLILFCFVCVCVIVVVV